MPSERDLGRIQLQTAILKEEGGRGNPYEPPSQKSFQDLTEKRLEIPYFSNFFLRRAPPRTPPPQGSRPGHEERFRFLY